MKIPRRQHSELSSESMTPMIDVVFLLLIFFVVASVGQVPDQLLPASIAEGISGEVPSVVPAQLVPAQEINIQLSRSAGQLIIRLNDSIVTSEQLQNRLSQLAKIDPSSRVILDPKDEVLIQHFMTVYERCQVLGFQNISFAVRSPG
ncbi:MAG: biopolymer transporter ExbD [Fuerstiella sp.]